MTEHDQTRIVPPPEFPTAKSVGERDWGEELLLVLSSGNYSMKKLVLKKGKKGGFQYHRLKDEASYIISGQLLIRFVDTDGKICEKTLGPGDFFRFPPGCMHQEIAITDVESIEVSTPHFNDRVRVESLFGDDSTDGLPTTNLTDIEFR